MATSKTYSQAEKDKLALVDIVDETFDPLTWQSSLSVAYDPLRPNKSIDLTGHGNIAIANTGTDGRSAGLYSIKQDTTPRTVTINGSAITINPASASKTLIQWVYDGTDYGFSTNYSVGGSPVVKATATEINTGTDDAKFATAAGLEGSKYLTQYGNKISATASGTDTYTATITPAISAYAAGQRFFITFTNANTGAATINLNSLGAIAIKKNGTTALASGDIDAGAVVLLAYDGTNFQIVGKMVNIGSTIIANGFQLGASSGPTISSDPSAIYQGQYNTFLFNDAPAAFIKGGITFSNNASNAAFQNNTGISQATLRVIEFNDGAGAGATWRAKPIAPAQIVADQNNYNPGGSSFYLDISTDASRDITGLTFTSAQVDGQTHVITNIGTNNFVIVNESASSTTTNRFHNSTGADIVLTPDQEINVVYRSTPGRWRVTKRGF